jgi:Mg2+ and Co2+ transporter CorA
MDVHVHIEQQLFDLEDSTKSFVNNKVIKTEKEIKKQLGEMYDRVDVLYKDLEKLSSTIDTAKETFLGKLIIK